MSLNSIRRIKTFGLSVRNATAALLLCSAFLCYATAQEASKFAEKSFCEEARLAAVQSDYEAASRFIKSCVESRAQKDAQSRAEDFLLGAEIEYYLENDRQAADYAALAEKHYVSLGDRQKTVGWFGVRLKKILAALEIEAGAFQSALKFYNEALEILAFTNESAQNSGGVPRRLKADILSGIAFVELKTGRYSEAISHLEAALEELDDSPLDNYSRAFIFNDFGHLLNEQRSHRQAAFYLKKAAQIWRQQKDWRNFAMAQQNLAVAYRGTRDFKEAQIYFEQVQDLAVKNNFVDLKTMSLQGLASLHQVRGQHRQTIEILQKALAETSAPVRRAEILWRLSTSQNQTGDKTSARFNANECYEWATAQKIENLRYLCATNLGAAYLPDSPSTAEKWFQKAVEITEELSRRVAGEAAEKVYFMQDKSAAYHELIKFFVKENKPEQALAVSEKLKSRVLREKLQNRTSSLLVDDAAIRNLNVAAGTVVVSYVLTDESCFAFMLKANEPVKIAVLPVGEVKMQERINRYRQSISSFSPTFKTEAKQLYDLLLKIGGEKISKAKSLIIVPDGALWELPFQSLVNSASGKYLVEEHEISYAPSLGILIGLKSSAAPKISRKNFVAFANSNYKDAAPLPEAEREAASIGKLYASSNVFVKTAATEKRVRIEAPEAKVLHLAVHGEINQINPFDSALLFTGEPGDDGRLTVAEILRMDLPDSLVVLSACDTSSGQVINGEGLLSLSWAFLASGGRGVVAAQWAVEEKATAYLMLEFYRALNKEKNNPHAALRAAQNKALKRPAPFNHPFYWSAFVLIGDAL